MSFFGLFKRKDNDDLEIGLKNITSRIFPFGEGDILRDCQRIDVLTNGKLPDSELRGFVAGCKTLVAINDSYDDDDFVRSTIARSKNRLNDVEARDVYVYLAGESMYRASVALLEKSRQILAP